MKNVLNILKVNELKGMAKIAELKGLTKKADLVDALSNVITDVTTISSYNKGVYNHDFVTFGTQFVEVKEVANNNNLPTGAVIGHPINLYNFGCLNTKHYDLLYNNNLATADDVVGFNLTEDATVFIVDTVRDYMMLHSICGSYESETAKAFAKVLENVETDVTVSIALDFVKASIMLDAIIFTKNAVKELAFSSSEYNLNGIEHEVVVVLNNDAIAKQTSLEVVEVNGDILTKVVDVRKAENASDRVVKTQYQVRKVSIDDLVWSPALNTYVVPANLDMSIRTVTMSETRLFRWYHNATTVEVEGTEVTTRYANNFIIFNAVTGEKKTDATDLLVKCILLDGYVDLTPNPVTGLTYSEEIAQCTTEEQAKDVRDSRTHLVTLQSASQARQGKYYFSNLDRDVVRDRLVYGNNFGEEVSISKMEARIALGTSSSTAVGSDFTVKVIKDRTYTENRIYLKVKTDGSNKVAMVSAGMSAQCPHGVGVKVQLTPTDGQGTIEVLPSAKIAHRLGLISKRELEFFVADYTTLADVQSNAKLLKVFSKIPNAFQIRRAGDKGLLVMFPHNEYGYNQDIVMCESMHKYNVPAENEADVELEICNWNKTKKDMVYLSYQFLQSLEISPNDVKALAKTALDKVTDGVMSDANVAMKFLGMLYNIGDTREDEGSILVSKVTKILAEDPTMINDRKVQTSLKKLVKKFLQELSFGRIPVQGAYSYIAVDPRFMLGADLEDCLMSGENYFNNSTGMYAGFRSPMIHSSEVARLNMIEDAELWFMKDLIILNPCDDTLPRMGGADL